MSAVPDQPTPPAPESPRERLRALSDEIHKAVVGQDAAVTSLVVALLCRGHVLLEGVPGVAKTLLVRSLAEALDVDMRRVQFTPDMMPGDVTGSLVYDNSTSDLVFREGPVFTNLLLADEINRTPPKTQSALLEAMEERQVTIDGRPRALPDPFMVVATQNPIEFDGTYALPEAQLDRFLLKAVLPLPEREQEVDVLRRHAEGFDTRDLAAAGLRTVADPASLRAAQEEVRQVRAEQSVLEYVVDVCRATRRSPSLSLGVSPRGAIALLRTASAWAYLTGRDFVTPDDVKTMGPATLSHRVRLTTEAELEGSQVQAVLAATLAGVPVPR
ncbi:MoxR family ATPase [Brachybacterium halotolerans subsp. kimchii]|uniref:AAA family ATPase n=1 Tax=Brachybacterium halotolerans TaxID=2795215 RepID=UPI001E36B26B|nr:MoxR family ATPase [Brachybacterium halotolerans]UEJ82597.1 MoxR family ATPase [Brachybacterium halotolerans subsp. kimchii]